MHQVICVMSIGNFRLNTGLSKRNGAKLRESFCPATAGYARLVISNIVPFSAQVCT